MAAADAAAVGDWLYWLAAAAMAAELAANPAVAAAEAELRVLRKRARRLLNHTGPRASVSFVLKNN